jgi:hypothetical protein
MMPVFRQRKYIPVALPASIITRLADGEAA